jgi:hypothetical protein
MSTRTKAFRQGGHARERLLLAAAALLATTPPLFSAPPSAAESAVAISFVESFVAEEEEGGPPVTAVGLRWTPPRAPAAGARVVVLVDTSASQVGLHKQRSLETLAGMLEKAGSLDRYCPAAADVSCVPLVEGFAPNGDKRIVAALTELDRRTPLGSTDLLEAIDGALAVFDAAGPEPKASNAIVYIGDGPGITGVDADAFRQVVETLASRQISFSCVGIGPQLNWPCLAALASDTGGVFVVPDDIVAPRDAGARMAAVVSAPIGWPTQVSVTSGAQAARLRLLPARLPPLRGDRDSVFLVEGDVKGAEVDFVLAPSGLAGATPVTIAVPDAAPHQENAYLAELARNARATDGFFLPLVGREGLDLARSTIRGEAATLAILSRQAAAAGADAAALRLAQASLRRDPDNPEAAVIREAVRRQSSTVDDLPVPAIDPLAVPAPTDDSLAEETRMRRLRSQRLEQEIAVRLRNARHLMMADPDRARSDLKEMQAEVKASDDLEPALRERLVRQIEMSLRESVVRSREKLECDLAAERRAAIGRERQRLDGELRQREERFKQLTERYTALLTKGIEQRYQRPLEQRSTDPLQLAYDPEGTYDEFITAEREVADEMAVEASNIYGNYPMPMTAREIARTAPIVARILHYDSQNMRFRRETQRNFMDALHLVDIASIPFVDEPPMHYPTAERWKELTELRKQYKSVDLSRPGSPERKIYDALDKTVDVLEFTDTPLRDVISQLRDKFDITIVPDLKALDDATIDLNESLVTQKVAGISLRSALKLILSSINPQPSDPLTYMVKDEVLKITTQTVAESTLITKVYPVGDLVISTSAGVADPFIDTAGRTNNAGRASAGAAGGGGMGMGMGAGGLGGAGGGGMFQIADARERVADTKKPQRPTAAPATGTTAGRSGEKPEASRPAARQKPLTESADGADVGLPDSILEATDMRAAIGAFLEPGRDPGVAPQPAASATESSSARPGSNGGQAGSTPRTDDRTRAIRMARIQMTAAELGRQGRFDKAAELLSATIACGHAEPWMYEALAIALEAAGRPREDVERALLSAADFASSPADLLTLANYLARFGSAQRAIRVCRQVARIDPDSREAHALAVTLAARSDDVETLRWACPGVLSNEWPADQQEIFTRAARLSRTVIDRLEKEGKGADAKAFKAAVDAALVRDIELEVSWNGDADVDLLVEEPPGTVCSLSAPRSESGGMLLADSEAASDRDNATHRERYVATEAFPGTYRFVIRRVMGKVAADTVTATVILCRGTDHEQRLRRQLPVGADDTLVTMEVPFGRRTEPLFDAQVRHDAVAQRQIGAAVLAQQLNALVDPDAAASLSDSRAAPRASSKPGAPFFRGGRVGYQPVIDTLNIGATMTVRAVVSADRRYVRISVSPIFNDIGQVTQFNFAGGGAQGTGGGGQGGGGGGAGGAGGGAGGGQAAGGGAGGAQGGGAGGAGGAGGGAGGAGGAGGGAAGGGAAGGCWVARAVYGPDNPRWLLFRHWLFTRSPVWIKDVYLAHGEAFAGWLQDKPACKAGIRLLMDAVIASQPTGAFPAELEAELHY